EFFNRVVDRVGDCAGIVFRHRRRDGQVAVGKVTKFVHQPQNRVLVGAVQLLRFQTLLLGLDGASRVFLEDQLRGGDQDAQGDQGQNRDADVIEVAARDLFLVAVFQCVGG